MDPVTHTLLGAALSRAGFRRWCPRSGALLALAANAPDIDVVAAVGGSLAYLDFHRHLTHTFLLTPLLAVATVGIVAAFRPSRLNWKRDLPPMFLTAVVGILSHLFLDWTNAYGIRLFLPFSGAWHQAGITSLVDVWIWLLLGIAFAGPLLSGLVDSEIGGKKTPGATAAIIVLILLCGYEFGRYVLHGRAVRTLESRLYRGEVPMRVLAIPTPVDPWRWTGIVETGGFYSLHDVNLRGQFDPAAGRTIYKPDPHPAIEAARKTETVRRFLAFSQAPYWRVTPLDGPEPELKVEVMDLRFGQPPEPLFVATVVTGANGRVLSEGFRFRPAPAH